MRLLAARILNMDVDDERLDNPYYLNWAWSYQNGIFKAKATAAERGKELLGFNI